MLITLILLGVTLFIVTACCLVMGGEVEREEAEAEQEMVMIVLTRIVEEAKEK